MEKDKDNDSESVNTVYLRIVLIFVINAGNGWLLMGFFSYIM